MHMSANKKPNDTPSKGRGTSGAKSAGRRFDAESYLTTVGAGRTISVYKKKSMIFQQGGPCDAVFYILAGQVDLSVVSKQGKERVVGQLGPRSFIGEGCLAGHPRFLASARVLVEATVARIETKTLSKALNEHSELARRFMAFLLERNSQVEADLIDQLFNSSEKRLARLLIMLAQIGQAAELRTISGPISQELMAARVGTTRSRINYFMNKFRKLGLIEYKNGELKVHSSLLNVVIQE
jgi:CRP/FNR family cyclic AMP-dependent transcriptional regulator